MKTSLQHRVVFYGLGEIGIRALRIALKNRMLNVVGAIDIDKSKVGKDLSELISADKNTGVKVASDPKRVISETNPDVVIHSTVSLIEIAAPQIKTIASAGANCISSTEELFFPRPDSQTIFKELDKLAREKGVTILGTGVNPGYIMDTLPLFLTRPCQELRSITVERIVDAATRRMPLQRKVGMGLTPQEFKEKVEQKEMGHKGLTESIYGLAVGLGWELDEIEERVEPIATLEKVVTKYFTVEKGQTIGMKHTGHGIKDGKKVISLDLQMYAGAKDPHDRIIIEGVPPLDVYIKGGIPGDEATAAILVNSIPLVREAYPGLINTGKLPCYSS